MRVHALPVFAITGLLASAALPACSLDVSDLNNPSLDDLKKHPTAISIGAACTGLLIGKRSNKAAENGWVLQLGVLGREAYNFDAADPRYVNELLVGELNRGSPFGGNFWANQYGNIQLGNIVLEVLDNVSDLSVAQKAAIRGFIKTIEALDLLDVVVTHDTNGVVLDVPTDPLGDLTPIVRDTKQQYARIASLLDSAVADLNAGGESFPFALPNGFDNVAKPATFLTFNRAVRARVAAYDSDYATVLTVLTALAQAQSFFNDSKPPIDFNAGVYYAYSTKPGDTANALINRNIFVHPSIAADVKSAMGNVDARFARKTELAANPGKRDTTLTFRPLYPNPEASVPLIRNEELILLKAEALFKTGKPIEAIAELNIVRTLSGNLTAIPPTTDEETFINELLYDRKYSLLFEGGHRWIDARRFGKLNTLPIFIGKDDDGKDVPDTLNVRYPIPLGECNARPGEQACTLGSTNG